MKTEMAQQPQHLKEKWPGQFRVFSWVEYVAAVPQVVTIITTWKQNRLPNACLEAWSMFSGDTGGYYVVFSIMNSTHTYANLLRTGEFVFNFPDADLYGKCEDTIQNNADDVDEISASGLSVEQAQVVDSPRIRECFLNLECKLRWHRPLHDGSVWHVFAGEVVHVAIDDNHLESNGRYGAKGFVCNIHAPLNPKTGEQAEGGLGQIMPMRRK